MLETANKLQRATETLDEFPCETASRLQRRMNTRSTTAIAVPMASATGFAPPAVSWTRTELSTGTLPTLPTRNGRPVLNGRRVEASFSGRCGECER